MEIPENKPLSVTDVNRIIKNIISGNDDIKNIWVKGEISNYSKASSGHIYFSLKDPGGVIRCTFFSFNNRNHQIKKLEDGMEVIVLGTVSVYEQGGSYNLNITKIEDLGKGDFFLKIEELKKKLNAKGIFSPENKKPIPIFPVTLGIATSPTGAAIEDILRIAKERYPNINIVISPCVVQGADAPQSIIDAIDLLNKPHYNVDVIIAGRGGGSYEDLMAFNEESVVMAFYHSRIPIISAVGHQVDNVLSDLAADQAAPTPTAAAELAVPDVNEWSLYLNDTEKRLFQATNSKMNLCKEKLQYMVNRRILKEPMELLTDRIQKIDEILARINISGIKLLSAKKQSLQKQDNINLLMKSYLKNKTHIFQILQEKIENFSPLLTLKRGYAVVRTHKKNVIQSKYQINPGELIEIILSDGKIEAEVK